jgi:GNAT superfamily N-acetyltransferase
MRISPELLASLVIRRAARDDVPAILGLYADDPLGSRRDSISPESLAQYLAAFDEIDADPRSAIYVAASTERALGTFQITFLRHLTHGGSKIGQVEAVHVASDYRGRGIGEAMMRFAIDLARRGGCGRMQLTSNKRRTDAHRFYERLGFAASHEGMKLILTDASSPSTARPSPAGQP